MTAINHFLITTGIRGTLGLIASQFAVTLGEQLLEQLKNEHQEMKNAFVRASAPNSKIATA